jgi:hypothetical protein
MKSYFDVGLLVVVVVVGVLGGRTNRRVVPTGDGLFEEFGRRIDPVAEKTKQKKF